MSYPGPRDVGEGRRRWKILSTQECAILRRKIKTFSTERPLENVLPCRPRCGSRCPCTKRKRQTQCKKPWIGILNRIWVIGIWTTFRALYLVHTIKQSSSEHRAIRAHVVQRILNAFAGCLLDDCSMFSWLCKRDIKERTERCRQTELNWHGFVFDELTIGQGVMHYNRHHLTATVITWLRARTR